MSKLSAQRTAQAPERMAVYHLDAPMVGIASGRGRRPRGSRRLGVTPGSKRFDPSLLRMWRPTSGEYLKTQDPAGANRYL